MNRSSLAQSETDFPVPIIPQNMIDLEHPELGADFVPLAEPILTLDRAVEFVLPHDNRVATWETPWTNSDIADNFSDSSLTQPWTVDTIVETQRFEVGYFSSRAKVYQRLFDERIWLAPEVEVQDGNVWSLTIKGNVQAQFIGGANDGTIYDGITYLLSARTGLLLGIKTGLPIVDENGNDILRDEFGNVIDEEGNIIWEVNE